ncbi:MAG: HIT family protein [Granulosicoccaceae bacterium]
MQFKLDHRLEQDGMVLAESERYILNLMNDCRYIWLVLIPKVANAKDVFDLTEEQQIDLALLSNKIGKIITQQFNGDKFNVASLGNMVPQLHVHLIVRTEGDAAWPGPIWGVGDAVLYSEQQQNDVIKQLQAAVMLVN